jgi:hypothetical protein
MSVHAPSRVRLAPTSISRNQVAAAGVLLSAHVALVFGGIAAWMSWRLSRRA